MNKKRRDLRIFEGKQVSAAQDFEIQDRPLEVSLIENLLTVACCHRTDCLEADWPN